MKMNLKEKIEKRLLGAKFRIINEKLYKKPNIKLGNELIKIYHDGFSDQVKKWPVNPLDIIIKNLKTSKNLIIADLGCGEARIADEVGDRHKIYSCDLHKVKDGIIKCDIENTPIEKNSVDVVVFCLSLMKRNAAKSIIEANRISKINGVMYIAEVVSRIENNDKFVADVEAIGYKIMKIDKTNKFFVYMEFKKVKNFDNQKKILIPLKPCNFKTR